MLTSPVYPVLAYRLDNLAAYCQVLCHGANLALGRRGIKFAQRRSVHKHPKSATPGRSPGSILATAAVSRVCFADVEEQAAALTGWNQSYMQISAGRFFGEVRQIHCNGVRLFIEDLQQSVLQTGHIGAEHVALGVPVAMHGHSLFCGESIERESLYVFSGNAGFEFHSPRTHVMVGLEIDETVFATLRSDTKDGLREFGRRAHLHAVEGSALGELRQFLLGLFEAVAAMPDLLREAPVRSGIVDALLEKVAPVVAGEATGRGENSLRGRHRLLEQARGLVEARLSAPPSVAELCLALGVSRRTLQTAFQDTLGIGPLGFLRVSRLNAVRRALKSAESVTRAATDFGFWHFGHFAHDYRAMFGELPSDTFRRYRLCKHRA